MPVDNTVYDRLGDQWWDPRGFLHFLHAGLGPARSGYFARVLAARGLLDHPNRRALDVGCGGGLLAEQMADTGMAVLGVDPSAGSLRAARSHAATSEADVVYARGVGEALPVADGAVDVVFCCDMLEHVDAVDAVLAEIARVLAPGGVLCFDTVNRTWRSHLTVVKIMQDWAPLRVVPEGVHDHRQFIRPAELVPALARVGLHVGELVGFSPGGGPASLPGTARALRRAATGRIDQATLGRRLRMVAGRDLSASYGGYAVRGRTATPSGS